MVNVFKTILQARKFLDIAQRAAHPLKATKSDKLILEAWKKKTGCPILLNTSLNIKGQPMVNDTKDGKAFTKKYGVKVL